MIMKKYIAVDIVVDISRKISEIFSNMPKFGIQLVPFMTVTQPKFRQLRV